MSGSIAAALNAVQEQMRQAALNAGRPPESVRLLAVSKTFPASDVLTAYQAGCRRFGENRVQELEAKVPQLPGDVEWHLIGHLQSNKAAKAVRLAAWIHSVDSLNLLERLDRIAGEEGKRPVILLEVHLSGEGSKSGAEPEALPELAQAAAAARNLDWRGLMTMAPLTADREAWKRTFRECAGWRERLQSLTGRPLPELSMGMSGDFPEAIACGATIVRVGSAIFGHRDYGPVSA